MQVIVGGDPLGAVQDTPEPKLWPQFWFPQAAAQVARVGEATLHLAEGGPF